AAFRSTWVPWAQLAGLQTRGRGELWLVRTDGTAVRLPVLRSPRDLPRLHAASAGRLGVPDVER
ncbi:MAG: PH domain-containing protein, partial [Mycobacteriales bacterium]